ncbi:hypothetical protein ACGGZK_13240 [Agromyces sp. MMS24-K17]|uniref:hypothetical protein n=1 Tax=Agromyces sp. MMS24-K17 TaxID=3372850 RepID=UPI00375540B2
MTVTAEPSPAEKTRRRRIVWIVTCAAVAILAAAGTIVGTVAGQRPDARAVAASFLEAWEGGDTDRLAELLPGDAAIEILAGIEAASATPTNIRITGEGDGIDDVEWLFPVAYELDGKTWETVVPVIADEDRNWKLGLVSTHEVGQVDGEANAYITGADKPLSVLPAVYPITYRASEFFELRAGDSVAVTEDFDNDLIRPDLAKVGHELTSQFARFLDRCFATGQGEPEGCGIRALGGSPFSDSFTAVWTLTDSARLSPMPETFNAEFTATALIGYDTFNGPTTKQLDPVDYAFEGVWGWAAGGIPQIQGMEVTSGPDQGPNAIVNVYGG